MITMRFDPAGGRRIEDLVNLYNEGTAILLGGSPNLPANTFELLNKHTPLLMAINNAGVNRVTPTFWCGGDHPDCYAVQILNSPTVFKFASALYCMQLKSGTAYHAYPNIRFFIPKQGIPWEDAFRGRKEVPWYSNTLYSSILILYNLGIRKILLLGCDFDNSVASYSHDTDLTEEELAWNTKLYKQQKEELHALKTLFSQQGLELVQVVQKPIKVDTDIYYNQITLETALGLCTYTDFEGTANLPHSSSLESTYENTKT